MKLINNAMQGDRTSILIVFVIALALSGLGYLAWWHMNFKHVYSQVKYDKGVITDMNYKASYSTTSYNSTTKRTSTTHHPAKHYVYFLGKVVGENYYNNERLYQRVRIDEGIKIEYREKWKVRKDNERDREFVSYVIDVIVNEKGRRIDL